MMRAAAQGLRFSHALIGRHIPGKSRVLVTAPSFRSKAGIKHLTDSHRMLSSNTTTARARQITDEITQLLNKHKLHPDAHILPGSFCYEVFYRDFQTVHQAIHSVFLHRLFSGTLPANLFKDFLRQDLHYLVLFRFVVENIIHKLNAEGLNNPRDKQLWIQLAKSLGREIESRMDEEQPNFPGEPDETAVMREGIKAQESTDSAATPALTPAFEKAIHEMAALTTMKTTQERAAYALGCLALYHGAASKHMHAGKELIGDDERRIASATSALVSYLNDAYARANPTLQQAMRTAAARGIHTNAMVWLSLPTEEPKALTNESNSQGSHPPKNNGSPWPNVFFMGIVIVLGLKSAAAAETLRHVSEYGAALLDATPSVTACATDITNCSNETPNATLMPPTVRR